MSPSLLLVEDDPAVGETVCHMLQEAGYRCEWVSTGHRAVALVESRVLSVDLFVIDVRLPDTGKVLHPPQHALEFTDVLPGE